MAIKLGTCNAVAIIKYQYMLWEVLAWTSLEVFRALTRDENLSTACLPNWSMTPFSCIMISDLLPNCSFSWDPCRCHEFLPYHPSSTDTIEGSHLRRKKAEYEEVQIEAHAGEAHAVKKNVLQRTLNVRTIDQYQDYVDGLIRSWWASSPSAPKRHGTITVRELTAGPEVSKVGFGVASLPPEPVVVKKVTARSWAAEHELRSGDVLLEVNGLQMSEMSRAQFLSLMETRPLGFKFIINPLKNKQLHSQKEDDTDDAGSRSSQCSQSEDETASADVEREECQMTSRQSVSDWYLGEEAASERARKGSLTSWYLDGEQLPDNGSRLTSHHRLSASVPITGSRCWCRGACGKP
eukprot:symbB.v1.2.029511.t1/scaffold3239.1/size60467/2